VNLNFPKPPPEIAPKYFRNLEGERNMIQFSYGAGAKQENDQSGYILMSADLAARLTAAKHAAGDAKICGDGTSSVGTTSGKTNM